MAETYPPKGSLLVAEPFMWDPNFKRTVSIICENDDENGTFGFVLNKPLQMKLHEAIHGIKKFNAPLFYGGPVELDTLHFLHNIGNVLEGSVQICDGLFWGGNFQQTKDLINKGLVSPNNFRFFLGYSGWEPNQLNKELEDNSWIVHHVTAKHIFQDKSDALWKIVLQEKGGEYAQMVNYPEDPTYN